MRECARIVRPSGPVFAAAISRWAVRIDGMLRERLARMADPADRSAALDVARAIERVPELIGFGPHLIATGIRP
ncbi:MAG: hypothetical protein ABSB59_27970 [Streptosporangiaceae bacterium]